jgi:nucleoside 2-deoxyribosyltransferase
MRAYIAIKYHEDNSNRDRIEAIASALATCGFDTVCVMRDIERWGEVDLAPQELMQRSFLAIDACGIVVVDLTEKGVGIGIEAGYAYARSKPIVAIAQHGSDISATLRGIATTIVIYDRVADLPHLLQPKLRQG